MGWEIQTSRQVTKWLDELDRPDYDKIAAALELLATNGPMLRRPLVGEITNSRFHNMKEVRSVGKHMRILFAFDPERHAILLIGGDKAGDWNAWYKTNIPAADDLYERHLNGETI